MNYPEQPWQGRRFATACKNNRAIGLALLVFWLVGCQLLQPADDTSPEPAVAVPVDAPVPTMQSVIASLEAGEFEEAESILLRLIDARPGNPLALRFLEQLQSDPRKLMGTEYEEVTVRAGESLSVIAARELGDGMQFFALARYNQIAVPRRLAPGMQLKIPLALKLEPSLMVDGQVETAAEVAPEQAGEGLALAGRQLIADQRYQQAIALLTAAARAGNLEQDGYLALALAGAARARELAAEDHLDAGLELLERLAALVDQPAQQQLDPERRRLNARVAYRDAVAERRAGRLAEALASFQKASELDPEFDSAREQSTQLRDVLVMQHHEKALIHYRDQQLSEAISLWEQALSLNEDFEPAQVYLARSRALKARLEELDS